MNKNWKNLLPVDLHLQEMLQEFLQREAKWNRSETCLQKEEKSIREGISEGKIKASIFLFLFI